MSNPDERPSIPPAIPRSRWAGLDRSGKAVAVAFALCLAAVLAAYLWPRETHERGERPADAAEEEGGLLAAVERGDVETAAVVLSADPTEANAARAESGDRPLNRAAARGDAAMVELLLQNGARADARGAGGSTPLHDAVRGGHLDAADRLLQAGAKVDARDDENMTPLLLAVRLPDVSLARLLLQNGASPDAAGGSDMLITPLLAAEKSPAAAAMTDLLRRSGAR